MIDFFSQLDKYMKYKGLNDNKITVAAGISNGLIGKARKKGGSLSQENISKILYTYSDLSADWLLTGRGEMLRDSNIQPPETSVIYKSDPKDIAALSDKQMIIDRDAELISALRDKIRGLEAQLSTRPTGLYTAHSVGTTQEVEKPHK